MSIHKIILHVGTPKAGTSSLQAWLDQSGSSLSDHGVRYLKSFRKGPSHNYLTRLVAGGDRDNFITKTFADELSNCRQDTVLMSTETVFGTYRTTSILNLIPEEFWDRLQVVLYFRRQDLFLEALAKQKFKRGSQFGDLTDFIMKKKGRASYLSYIEGMARTKPDVLMKCKPFEKEALEQGDVVSDFWQLLGLPPEDSPEVSSTKENKTPSLALTQALAQFDFPSSYARRSVIKQLNSSDPSLFMSNDILSRENRTSLLETFRSENEQLSDICGWDLNELFHDGVDLDLESRCVATQHERNELFAYAQNAVINAVRNLSKEE